MNAWLKHTLNMWAKCLHICVWGMSHLKNSIDQWYVFVNKKQKESPKCLNLTWPHNGFAYQ